MADQVIRRLLVAFGVKDVDKALGDIERVNKRVDTVKEQFTAAAKEVAVFAGAITTATGLVVANSVATGKDAEEIQRRSRALQQSTREYQRTLAVFKTFNRDGSDVADVLGTLNDRAQDAMGGMKSFQEDFALVGLSVSDLRGKDPAGLLDSLADAVANSKDQSKAHAAVVRLLGDDIGNELMPMLLEGSAGMRRIADEAEAMGVVMDEKALAASSRLAMSWRQMMQVVTGLRHRLGAALAPVVQDVVDRTLRWVRANGELIRSGIESFTERARRGMGLVLDVLERIDTAIQRTIGWRGALSALAGAAGFAGILVVGRRLYLLFNALLSLWGASNVALSELAPALTGAGIGVGWIAAAVAAAVLQFVGLVLVLQDFYGAVRGVDSVTGDIIGRFAHQDSVVGSLANALQNLVRMYRGIFTLLREGSDDVAAFFDVLGTRFDEWSKRNTFTAKWVRRIRSGLEIAGKTVSGILRGLIGILDTFRMAYDMFTDAIGNAGGFLEVTGNQLAGDDATGASWGNWLADRVFGPAPATTNNTTNNTTAYGPRVTINAGSANGQEVADILERDLRQAEQGAVGVL